jgi:hypothetical protein
MTHLGSWNISYGQKKGRKSIHMCIGWKHGKVYNSITLAVYISSSQEIGPKPIIKLLYIYYFNLNDKKIHFKPFLKNYIIKVGL